MEISHLKKSFKTLCRNNDSITLSSFTANCQVHAATESYIRKHILPRLFAVMDGKKDNVLDFEEYVCAVALFRIGTTEEKIRVLFLMYEPFKGLHLQKESLRRLLVDATVAIQKEEVPVATLELWILEQIELSECMADMVTLLFFSYSLPTLFISTRYFHEGILLYPNTPMTRPFRHCYSFPIKKPNWICKNLSRLSKWKVAFKVLPSSSYRLLYTRKSCNFNDIIPLAFLFIHLSHPSVHSKHSIKYTTTAPSNSHF